MRVAQITCFNVYFFFIHYNGTIEHNVIHRFRRSIIDSIVITGMNISETTSFEQFALVISNTTTRPIGHNKVPTAAHQNSKDLINSIHFYLLGFIIPSGILCNAFCLFVCALSVGLRRTTTGHYLMALASADLLFLIADLARWMNTTSPKETR